MTDETIEHLQKSVEEFDEAVKQLQDDQSDLSKEIDDLIAQLQRDLLACLDPPSPTANL